MKREEKIFLLIFTALLVRGLGVALWLGELHEPSATIQFTQAHLDSSGELALAYS